MKTMTCRQLGGPCDFSIHGSSADDIIKNGEKYIKQMVAQGDVSCMNAQTQEKFASTPEDILGS